jgi:hypothetical protein
MERCFDFPDRRCRFSLGYTGIVAREECAVTSCKRFSGRHMESHSRRLALRNERPADALTDVPDHCAESLRRRSIYCRLGVISKQRFGSAAAFGMLLSSLAVGSLLGSLLPALIKFHYHRGLIVLSFGAVIGAEMIAMGVLHSFITMMVLLAILGFGSGLTAVCFQSWLQARIDRNFLGRVMSIFMFATFGLLPISYAVAGALAQAKLSLMFMGSGALVLVATAIAAVNKQIRAID